MTISISPKGVSDIPKTVVPEVSQSVCKDFAIF